MFFLFWWYHRASWPLRLIALAVLFIVFVATIVRVHKAVHATQERNSSVHTRRNSR
jgi:membrane protein implicated in regulation of membrane protease activity